MISTYKTDEVSVKIILANVALSYSLLKIIHSRNGKRFNSERQKVFQVMIVTCIVSLLCSSLDMISHKRSQPYIPSTIVGIRWLLILSLSSELDICSGKHHCSSQIYNVSSAVIMSVLKSLPASILLLPLFTAILLYCLCLIVYVNDSAFLQGCQSINMRIKKKN